MNQATIQYLVLVSNRQTNLSNYHLFHHRRGLRLHLPRSQRLIHFPNRRCRHQSNPVLDRFLFLACNRQANLPNHHLFFHCSSLPLILLHSQRHSPFFVLRGNHQDIPVFCLILLPACHRLANRPVLHPAHLRSSLLLTLLNIRHSSHLSNRGGNHRNNPVFGRYLFLACNRQANLPVCHLVYHHSRLLMIPLRSQHRSPFLILRGNHRDIPVVCLYLTPVYNQQTDL